tara:strand:+ start:13148 stop:13414 length:267 start_codon:yes stop_codon:yes gene_type:complete
MSDQNDDQAIQLKKYFEETSGTYDPEQSLHKALKAAKSKNASRDILTLFTGWVWVLFAGFGASIYTEVHKRKYPSKINNLKKNKFKQR